MRAIDLRTAPERDKADPTARCHVAGKYGATLIYSAACWNLEWLIKPLFDRGANVNLATLLGETALMFAVKKDLARCAWICCTSMRV